MILKRTQCSFATRCAVHRQMSLTYSRRRTPCATANSSTFWCTAKALHVFWSASFMAWWVESSAFLESCSSTGAMPPWTFAKLWCLHSWPYLTWWWRLSAMTKWAIWSQMIAPKTLFIGPLLVIILSSLWLWLLHIYLLRKHLCSKAAAKALALCSDNLIVMTNTSDRTAIIWIFGKTGHLHLLRLDSKGQQQRLAPVQHPAPIRAAKKLYAPQFHPSKNKRLWDSKELRHCENRKTTPLPN